MKKFVCLGFGAVVFPVMAQAAVDPYELSLEELMNVPVAISSRKALSQRDTPGIVTVITGEEIRHSGARDLIDVLRQVPGFDFRVMVNNSIGPGMRGQIGSDGRILMLIDGIEVNEHRYGGTVFGQGFPVEQIARIEIVRGSALALYGGAAELGVINIITKSADELDGFHVGAGVGYTTDSKIRSREQANLMAGSVGGAVKWTAMAHASKALRSDRIYQDATGPSFDMADANAAYLKSLNVGVQSGGFSARLLHDEPRFNDRDGPGYFVRSKDAKNTFNSDALMMNYRNQAGALLFAPDVMYQQQNPRRTISGTTGNTTSETSLKYAKARLPLDWDVSADWHLAGGVEYLREDYKSVVRSTFYGLYPLPFERTTVAGYYAESQWYNSWGNLTASFRWDDHSHAGMLRAERLGYTRIVGDWHVKLMGSYATRAPSMEDYAYAAGKALAVKPETSRTWEAETGYRLSPDSQLTANIFDITTLDTLLLGNREKAHTRGLELVYKMRDDWGHADFSYSYYNAAGTDLTPVQVADYTNGPAGEVVDGGMNLAFPAHKLTASLHYKLSSSSSFNPSLVYLGPRWGYVAPLAYSDTTDPFNPVYEGTLKKFGATPLLNLVLYWEDSGIGGLDVTLGLYNALNQEVDFIQPFDAGHAPLPDMSREVMLRAQYKF